MRLHSWKIWAAAALSAGLLELPFPLAGPMPPWRSVFAWWGLVPLLWAVVVAAEAGGRGLRRSFLAGYMCGVLWFAGNCYWIYDTMLIHGNLPAAVSVLLLLGFSLVLGGYFGLFALGLGLVRLRFGRGAALASAPFLWVAQELAASRITSVPWDQLGYSQVDNGLAMFLGPWTGVYGVSFVLVSANAGVLGLLWLRRSAVRNRLMSAMFLLEILVAFLGSVLASQAGTKLLGRSQSAPPVATAVLVQPNLDVANDAPWTPQVWEAQTAEFRRLAGQQCKSYIAGIPQTGASMGEVVCPPYGTHPDLVAWPESPAPFFQQEPAFQDTVKLVAKSVGAPVVVGGIGMDFAADEERWRQFNSAMLIDPNGRTIGRYDKIHLVPFGEFVPFHKLLFFAKKLTGKVSQFDRGKERSVFRIVDQQGQMRRYGFFICYEAVFAEEVREFAKNGAQVLVNLSDDGWYGDTSAPWQHLNMARMRAIENHRWILRDTNNGVTAAIDPNGRVRQSIPRHAADALPAQYGFRDDLTFYTAHGDVFAWCCTMIAIGIAAAAWKFGGSPRSEV